MKFNKPFFEFESLLVQIETFVYLYHNGVVGKTCFWSERMSIGVLIPTYSHPSRKLSFRDQ